ncbi:PEP-CTERM sorting domain-containing protein [Parvularcula maris]|uniref:PEP-CTERM sorting domain-containing protein n=1 Tax=Parvularcula maris TaxID=2965077 RepID=A0A9X2RH45_9PROT|nr:PEP-CTERM sorting domain-containing protein [Parvularcula maris]MCQ8184530.1 PEP-CTERM sorting domain-containing protein [Parvularcula maris]
MFKQIVAAAAALGVMSGAANAAFIDGMDVGETGPFDLFVGNTFNDTGFLFGSEGEQTIQYDFVPNAIGGGALNFDVSFSATAASGLLEVLLVSANGTSSALDIEEGGSVDSGTINFDDFNTADAFSVIVTAGAFTGTIPFTLTVVAGESTADQVVPVPGAGILLATAIGGFAAARRRRNAA